MELFLEIINEIYAVNWGKRADLRTFFKLQWLMSLIYQINSQLLGMFDLDFGGNVLSYCDSCLNGLKAHEDAVDVRLNYGYFC